MTGTFQMHDNYPIGLLQPSREKQRYTGKWKRKKTLPFRNYTL